MGTYLPSVQLPDPDRGIDSADTSEVVPGAVWEYLGDTIEIVELHADGAMCKERTLGTRDTSVIGRKAVAWFGSLIQPAAWRLLPGVSTA